MIIEFMGHKYNLPFIAQYDSIPYANELCCPNCSQHTWYDWMNEMCTDRVEGYCVNPQGEHMIVKECKYCHEKYRFHLFKWYTTEDGKRKFDTERWEHEVWLHLSGHEHNYLRINE